MKSHIQREKRRAIPTAGEILPDGVGLELIRDTSDPKQLRVLSWRGKILDEGLQISVGGRLYEPVHINRSIAKALHFPLCVAPLESTRELFNGLHRVFSCYLKQSDSCSTKLVYLAFASWVPDLLPMAPVLWVVAPMEGPRLVLLQLLSLVCRRAIVLVGVTRGDLRSIPMSLQLMLLLDEPDMRPAMEHLILSSSRRGVYTPNGRGIMNLYGPKVVCSRSLPRNTTLASSVLRVVLTPTAQPITTLDAKSEQDIAAEFQSRFIAYRLRNFSNVRAPKFDARHLSVQTQALAMALGAAIVGDKGLQEQILPLLTADDEEIRAEQSGTIEALVIETVLYFCHKVGVIQIRSSEVAKKVNATYKGRGSDEQISAESAGWKMKNLGLPTGTIDSAGNGLKLTDSTRRLAHELSRTYSVLTLRVGFRAGCTYCNQLKGVLEQ